MRASNPSAGQYQANSILSSGIFKYVAFWVVNSFTSNQKKLVDIPEWEHFRATSVIP